MHVNSFEQVPVVRDGMLTQRHRFANPIVDNVPQLPSQNGVMDVAAMMSSDRDAASQHQHHPLAPGRQE